MNHPLRLATGSHKRGSGKGCAMNVISWENGDTTITDYPACADRMLAAIVQRVNDTYCTHRDGDLLCPPCSIEVLALAHRTVGSGGDEPLDRRAIWVRLAIMAAREVAHLNTDPRVMRAIEAAETWVENPTTSAAANAANAATAANAAAYAANAATAAADAAYAAAANAAAAYAANAADAADAAAAYAAAANAAAAYAATAADAADAAASARLRLAHRLIDEFNRLTGRSENAVDPVVTQRAIAAMCAV